MAFKLRESADIMAATKRLAGLRAIDPTGKLDLGNGHTVPAYEAQIADVEQQLATYNQRFKDLDKLKNNLDAAEKALRKETSDLLTATGQRYKKDSSEYEQAGGIRERDRKKPVRKPKPPKPGA